MRGLRNMKKSISEYTGQYIKELQGKFSKYKWVFIPKQKEGKSYIMKVFDKLNDGKRYS